jgi:hypothetical protein
MGYNQWHDLPTATGVVAAMHEIAWWRLRKPDGAR